MSLTPLGLMIGPLNIFLTDDLVTPLDAAEHILERLRKHEYVVVHEPCGEPWTACRCSQAARRDVPLDSWTGKPCQHDGDDLGRFEVDVCHGCGTEPAKRSGDD